MADVIYKTIFKKFKQMTPKINDYRRDRIWFGISLLYAFYPYSNFNSIYMYCASKYDIITINING